jgi:hypothetical protein
VGKGSAANNHVSSRARAGRDCKRVDLIGRRFVSIHAPARGATRRRLQGPKDSACFNPRARAGRDLDQYQFIQLISFQSTRPRGARPLFGAYSPADTTGFNPRARAGRTFRAVHPCDKVDFSIPRRAGARPGDGVARDRKVSIHAPRGRDFASKYAWRLYVFNPRPARADRASHPSGNILFQSTRPAGRDSPPCGLVPSRYVSIHAPRGARRSTLRRFTGTTFQSTRPRGARRGLMPCSRAIGFNPRAARARTRAVRDVEIESAFQSTRRAGPTVSIIIH